MYYLVAETFDFNFFKKNWIKLCFFKVKNFGDFFLKIKPIKLLDL